MDWKDRLMALVLENETNQTDTTQAKQNYAKFIQQQRDLGTKYRNYWLARDQAEHPKPRKPRKPRKP